MTGYYTKGSGGVGGGEQNQAARDPGGLLCWPRILYEQEELQKGSDGRRLGVRPDSEQIS